MGCIINLAVSLAEGNLGREMNCAALENLSRTVRMVVSPSDGGRPVTKSWIYGIGGGEEQGVVEGGQPELAAESCSVHTQSQCRQRQI